LNLEVMALFRKGLTGLLPKLISQAEAAACSQGLQGLAPSWREEDAPTSSSSAWIPLRGERGWFGAVRSA